MPRLAVFADEIGPEFDLQLEVMVSEGVRALELRRAEGLGVLDLPADLCASIRSRAADAGVEIFSIGSPLGKVDVAAPIEAELERLRVALDLAHFFGTRRIRIFSFFVPEGGHAAERGRVMDYLGRMTAAAAAADVLLCHENEARIYGESLEQCLDLLTTIDSPYLRAIHDTSNFLCAGSEPYPAAYEALRPYLEYIHIKDRNAQGTQPAGEGDGRMPELFAALQRDGYDGYLSLEPHIGGGPDNFRRAARALKRCLDDLGWPYA